MLLYRKPTNLNNEKHEAVICAFLDPMYIACFAPGVKISSSLLFAITLMHAMSLSSEPSTASTTTSSRTSITAYLHALHSTSARGCAPTTTQALLYSSFEAHHTISRHSLAKRPALKCCFFEWDDGLPKQPSGKVKSPGRGCFQMCAMRMSTAKQPLRKRGTVHVHVLHYHFNTTLPLSPALHPISLRTRWQQGRIHTFVGNTALFFPACYMMPPLAPIIAFPTATESPLPNMSQAIPAAPELTSKPKRKRARRTVQQRAAPAEATAAMWADVDKGRLEYLKLIETISIQHNRYAYHSTQSLMTNKLIGRKLGWPRRCMQAGRYSPQKSVQHQSTMHSYQIRRT